MHYQRLCPRERIRQTKVKVQHLFQCTADRIFSALSNVTVVVFRARVCNTEECYAFLRSKQIGLDGQVAVVGTPVEPLMVKHYIPCSDVLEEANSIFA
jgi:hypothetical protein